MRQERDDKQLELYMGGVREERAKARKSLLARGGRVVPAVIAALEKAQEKEVVALRGNTGAFHLAALLADFGDPSSLAALVRVERLKDNPFEVSPLRRVLEKLVVRGQSADIEALLALLTPSEVPPLPLRSEERVLLATTLVRIAEHDPKPELRAALPLLVFTLSTPFEYIALRKRLKAALTHESLPIPSVAAPQNQTTEDLPIPATKQSP